MSRAKRKSTDARILDYHAQTRSRLGKLTPKQHRRIIHKSKGKHRTR